MSKFQLLRIFSILQRLNIDKYLLDDTTVVCQLSRYPIVNLGMMNTPATGYSIVNNNQGTVYEWQNDVITIRLNGAQTEGLFTLSEDAMKPTFKLGLHLHRKHAETFHVLEGDVEFRIGTTTHVAQAGTTIHVPPNTPHAARVVNGRQARMIMLYSPSGLENFLKEMKTFTNAQFADAQFMKTFNDKYDNIQLE